MLERMNVRPSSLRRKQAKGAPGLAFETWDPSNQFHMEAPLSPLSSRAYPDFLLHSSHQGHLRGSP